MDQTTRRYYQSHQFTAVYPKQSPQRPGIFERCDLHIFVLNDEPRVFVGGGEFGFNLFTREADSVEIEALAERFNLPELRDVLSRRTAGRPAAG